MFWVWCVCDYLTISSLLPHQKCAAKTYVELEQLFALTHSASPPAAGVRADPRPELRVCGSLSRRRSATLVLTPDPVPDPDLQPGPMDALSSLTSPASCPHLYQLPSNASISHVILRHYNHTGRLHNRTVSSSQGGVSVPMAVFLFVSVFIVVENLLVLVAVVSRIRHSRRWVYVCIANITLSDLLTGAAYLVNICMSGSQTFRLTPALWLFREGMLFVALAASIFSLLLIAVERYATMMRPLPQKSTAKTYYRIYGLVALCWLLALVIGFLPLLGWNCVCSLDECSTLLPLYSKTYILFSLLIFLVILLAIGVLYGAIYCHVHRSAQLGPQRSRKRSLALLKTVITIVGVFLLCWGPLFVLLLVDYFCASRHCALLFSADYFISLAVLNSGLNPVIYALGSSEMRRAIAERLFCCCVRAGLCRPDAFSSKETNSTSESRRDSLRNSFSRTRNLSVASPPSTPSKPPRRAPRKYRLSSTTSCLSVSSG
ncbi:sphingosine 1-phosphate receptor 4 [Betta splendens]|uniref:Sphingosine 1-phosphate receptor 4 n=1 Tax=Betta splendens TaxID=158456 RepID=A0A6P7MEY6_BETSP|nr:sphingosine 1-phosphate receptor 4 [Betta splendens]